MIFKSDWIYTKGTAEQVFAFFSDLNNMQPLMPEQVINWKSDFDTCSFTIKGMTDISLKVGKREPFSLIEMVPNGKVPFVFDLKMNIRQVTDQAEVMVEISADLNPMLAMMAKRPLQNLTEIMSEKVANLTF